MLTEKLLIRTEFVQILVRILSNQRRVEIGAEEKIRHEKREKRNFLSFRNASRPGEGKEKFVAKILLKSVFRRDER